MINKFETKAEEFRYYAMEKLSDGKPYGIKEIEEYIFKNSSIKRVDLPNGSMPTVFRDFRNMPKYNVKRVSRGVYQKAEGGISLTEGMETKLKNTLHGLDRDVKNYVRGSSIENLDVEEIKKAQGMIKDFKGLIRLVETKDKYK